VDFFRAVAQKSLEITDEAIDVSLSGRLQNDILVVVIPGIDEKERRDHFASNSTG
jgi:hypothetical protein